LTTPSQIYAGQNVTATEINALSRFVSVVTCTSVTNSSAETVIATVTIPATDAGLAVNGGYQLLVFGNASWAATPTLSFHVRIGSVSGTTLASLSAGSLSSGGSTVWWGVDCKVMITAAGSSGTFDATGQLLSGLTGSGAVVTSGNHAVTINTTAAVTLVVTAQWGTASTSNTATAEVGNLDRI
jgi:hypothetical protein